MAGGTFELSSNLGHDGVNKELNHLLDVIRFNYAWVLFVVFLLAYIISSICSADSSDKSKQSLLTGPGGKPLPESSARKSKEEREKRKKLREFSPGRKLLFLYLSIVLLATFVGNGVNIVIHALTAEDPWWCGEPTAVSFAGADDVKSVH